MKITRFEDIEAWKKARILMNKVYKAVKVPAFDEDREMRRQMRRAALSVMSNIAEGFDGGSDPEFRRFLRMAKRSSSELQSHFYAAADQGYIAQPVFTDLYESAAEVHRIIGGFIRYLRGKPSGR